MKIYFHQIHTEAHRRWKRGRDFADALERRGVEVSTILDSSCQVALCGSFETSQSFKTETARHKIHYPLKTVYLCWDLYPCNVDGTREGSNPDTVKLWAEYIHDLVDADMRVAPTLAAVRRMKQYVSRGFKIVAPACDPWWMMYGFYREGKHVLDVMRPYDDWGQGKVKRACDRLGIPCVESKGGLSFDEFQNAVIDAGVLVCAYDEASTGGLTLLEGYALGKPVVASDSVYNGVKDLFGTRGHYFRERDEEDLERAILTAWKNAPYREDSRVWVDTNFSDDAMAERLVSLMTRHL